MTTIQLAAGLRRPAMRIPRTRNWGIGLAFAAAAISGFSVWVNSYAVKEVRDPAVFTTTKNLVVGCALLVLLLGRANGAPALPKAWRKRWMLVALGVVGGSIPFVLFFEGLARSGPGNAAFIQKSLFLWVALLAVPLLHERIGRWQVSALGMLVVAQLLIGRPGNWRPGDGELLVLAATGFWTVETILARKLLPEVGAGLGATARMALGGLLLLGYLVTQGKADAISSLSGEQWRWVLTTSAILMIYVGTWYSALERAPATVVTSILALGAPITVALSTWSGKPAPNAEQLSGYLVLALALAVVALSASRQRPAARPVGP